MNRYSSEQGTSQKFGCKYEKQLIKKSLSVK